MAVFGADSGAASPLSVEVLPWADEPFTHGNEAWFSSLAAKKLGANVQAHETRGRISGDSVIKGVIAFDEKNVTTPSLHFAGTETENYGGHMSGALAAGERAATEVLKRLRIKLREEKGKPRDDL